MVRVRVFLLRSFHVLAVGAALASMPAPRLAGQEPSASSPGEKTATIYVYREGHFSGAKAHPLIFINDDFLTEMENGRYASMTVPEGAAVVTATHMVYWKTVDPKIPPPPGYWSSLPGCAAIDWRHWATGPRDDVNRCMASMNDLIKECSATVTKTGGPGMWIVTTHIPACNPKLEGVSAAYSRLHLATGERQVRMSVEAGKTYYVQWVFSPDNGFCGKGGCGGRLEIEEDRKAEKEMKGLKSAKQE